MNIAVLGAGAGGCAVAFDCAAHGHKVSLFDFEQFPESIEGVQTNGGIHCGGVLEGYQSVVYAGHEIEEALDGADIIYAVGPAYSTRPFAEICKTFGIRTLSLQKLRRCRMPFDCLSRAKSRFSTSSKVGCYWPRLRRKIPIMCWSKCAMSIRR